MTYSYENGNKENPKYARDALRRDAMIKLLMNSKRSYEEIEAYLKTEPSALTSRLFPTMWKNCPGKRA